MLNEAQFLLAKVAEEASEVAQAAIKCQLYGASHRYELYATDNMERLIDELVDLSVSVSSLLLEMGYPPIDFENRKTGHFAKLQVSWANHQTLLTPFKVPTALKSI